MYTENLTHFTKEICKEQLWKLHHETFRLVEILDDLLGI